MNAEKCRTHSLNNSKYKQAHKFPKGPRFKNPRLHTHQIYNVDLNTSVRSVGFARSKRQDLGKGKFSPSPQEYFLPDTLSRKSRSFGMGRKNVIFQDFLGRTKQEANTPGPNHYIHYSSLRRRSLTMGYRLPTEIDMLQAKKSPSPDRYNLDGICVNLEGKFPSSKFQNVRRIVFLGREDFQDRSQLLNVGPGTYSINGLTESRRKTLPTFGMAKRHGMQDRSKKGMPGPGEYSSFSQFPSQI